MTFEEFQGILACCPYDRLDPETRAAVDEAAVADERCREHLAWTRSIEAGLAPVKMARVTPQPTSSGRRRASGRRFSARSRAQGSGWARWAAAAAVLLIGAAAGWCAHAKVWVFEPQAPSVTDENVAAPAPTPNTATPQEGPEVATPDEPARTEAEAVDGGIGVAAAIGKPEESPDLKDVWPVLRPLVVGEGESPSEPLVVVRSGHIRMFPLGAETRGLDTFSLRKAEVGAVWADADFRLVAGGIPGRNDTVNFLVVQRGEQEGSAVINLGSDEEAPDSTLAFDSIVLRNNHSYLVRVCRERGTEFLLLKVVSQKPARHVDLDWERVSDAQADKLVASAQAAIVARIVALEAARLPPEEQKKKPKKTVVIPPVRK